ncbi:GerAB/ArcD/ProY family transporter [Bacillus sp. Marseille-P3661]|uniref:GerAB/ArcD/ProY family transporter n=1 Tax=Bacillus sp. Marseille-P3661 TaxID=1936234 RepID=UPI000C858100|nr:GerAB/ArcD/ProY family transporter [Bacillus sp. Marseille-P3661]
MRKDQINKSQLLALIILFEVGSTTLFAIGIEAKQDAWIAILIALVTGIGLLWVFTEIQSAFPDKNLAEILNFVLGKWIALPLILLYALSFFWTSSFILYEFSTSIVEYFLRDTPLVVIIFCILTVVVYSMLLGVEVIGRTAEIFLPWFSIFFVSIIILLLFSGDIKSEQLLPILEGGILPVLKTTPQVVNFPFGEMIIFLMYWCYVNNKQIVRKISIIAVSISGFILMLTVITMISVLGVDITSRSPFPLLQVIRKINVGNFLQRVDAIGGMILLLGGYFKGLLYFNGSRLAIQTVFNIKQKHQQWLIIVLSICLLWYTHVYFDDFIFYRWAGLEINTKMVYPIFQIFIPVLLLIIIKLKVNIMRKNERDKKLC